MLDGLGDKLWHRVRGWVEANANHVTLKFFADAAGEPIEPYNGYIRVYLSEGFLAQQKTWGNKHFPALHGGVSLTFVGNQQAAFTFFDRPPEAWTTAGAQLDFPITPLVPFNGGTVEIEAALYQASVEGPLATAVSLVGGFASLMGPPLAAAAAIADKVSSGLDSLFAATGNQPVLGLHYTMIAPGGGGNVLRPGYLAVIGTPEAQLGGTLSVDAGRLKIDKGAGAQLVTGVDYLVVKVECRRERDDWRLPELDVLIRTAGESYIRGWKDAFNDQRTDAIARAWNSTDLAPGDRKRVALLVQQEIDGAKVLGAVPGPERSIDKIAAERLVDRTDPVLEDLSLVKLLAT